MNCRFFIFYAFTNISQLIQLFLLILTFKALYMLVQLPTKIVVHTTNRYILHLWHELLLFPCWKQCLWRDNCQNVKANLLHLIHSRDHYIYWKVVVGFTLWCFFSKRLLLHRVVNSNTLFINWFLFYSTI